MAGLGSIGKIASEAFEKLVGKISASKIGTEVAERGLGAVISDGLGKVGTGASNLLGKAAGNGAVRKAGLVGGGLLSVDTINHMQNDGENLFEAMAHSGGDISNILSGTGHVVSGAADIASNSLDGIGGILDKISGFVQDNPLVAGAVGLGAVGLVGSGIAGGGGLFGGVGKLALLAGAGVAISGLVNSGVFDKLGNMAMNALAVDDDSVSVPVASVVTPVDDAAMESAALSGMNESSQHLLEGVPDMQGSESGRPRLPKRSMEVSA